VTVNSGESPLLLLREINVSWSSGSLHSTRSYLIDSPPPILIGMTPLRRPVSARPLKSRERAAVHASLDSSELWSSCTQQTK
jgi:hypothetical protein